MGWAEVPGAGHADLLDDARRGLWAVGRAWGGRSLAAKGVPRGGPAEAEEWLCLAVALRSLRVQASACRVAGSPATGSHGIDVFPRSPADGVVYRGLRARVHGVAGPRRGPGAGQSGTRPSSTPTLEPGCSDPAAVREGRCPGPWSRTSTRPVPVTSASAARRSAGCSPAR